MPVATIAALMPWREELRRAGKRLVLTNGVFDLIHVGHIRYLATARSFGDALVVAIDSDASARALAKGPGRPFVGQDDRAEVVAALRGVDHTVIFDGPGAMAVIEALRPDVYAKGEEYAGGAKALPEADVMARIGGTVRFVAMEPDRSTTRLAQGIRGG